MISVKRASRALSHDVGFVLLGTAALGVGLALSTTMFGVVDAVRNPQVAFGRPRQLFTIHWHLGAHNQLSQAELSRQVQEGARSFVGVAPAEVIPASLQTAADLRQVRSYRVSERWFSVVDVTMALGRAFTQGEQPDVAIVSHEIWNSVFQGRARIDGATIQLDGETRAIVGVLPRGSGTIDVLVPAREAVSAGSRAVVLPYVRLKEEVTLREAQAELSAIARSLTIRTGELDEPYAFTLRTTRPIRGELRDIDKILLGSALLILLLACANLAHLMLARGFTRRHEVAIQLAIGVPRRAVVTQLFLECLIVAAIGGVLGLFLAYRVSSLLAIRLSGELAWAGIVQPQLSWRVLLLTVASACAAAVVFGLLPTLKVVSSVQLYQALQSESGTTPRLSRRRYDPIVIMELAAAVVLLMNGVLLLRSLALIDSEVKDQNTIIRAAVLSRDTDSLARLVTRDQLVNIVSRISGVAAAAIEGVEIAVGAAVSSEATADGARNITTHMVASVSSDYFRVLRLPVTAGRDFERSDALTGAAVLDSVAAFRLYPSGDAVGRMIKMGGSHRNAPWLRIVGLIAPPPFADASDQLAPRPSVFVLRNRETATGNLLIRLQSDDPQLRTIVTNRIRELPYVAVGLVQPWYLSRERDLGSRRFIAWLFLSIGLVGLALGSLGLFGVLSINAAERMREFRVRLAMGASPTSNALLIVHTGAVMLLSGISIGGMIALVVSHMVDPLLIGINSADPASLAFTETIVVLCGVASLAVPALHAKSARAVDVLHSR